MVAYSEVLILNTYLSLHIGHIRLCYYTHTSIKPLVIPIYTGTNCINIVIIFEKG